MTKPSAPASNGRVPVADSAPILQNFTKRRSPMLRSTPPVIAASKSPADADPRTAALIAASAGGAGRVGGEVRAAEVEEVGDPAGDARWPARRASCPR